MNGSNGAEGPGSPPGPPPASAATAAALERALAGVLLGQPHAVRVAVAAFLAGGHLLIEDVPGVGKTLFAKALAQGIGGAFGRVQGTSDLLPTDLTGVSVFRPDSGSWAFEPGPLFHNVVLVDELNRATPRTQSALLEAMAERQVSIDGVTHALPEPFLVVATQNPYGDLGTFPLVAGQRDRFMVSLSLGLPAREVELALVTGHGGTPALGGLQPVVDPATWRAACHGVDGVHAQPEVLEYAVDLVGALRALLQAPAPSARGSLDLVRFAKAHALVSGRDYVTPDDVQLGAVPVLAHRIIDQTRTDVAACRALVNDVVLGRVPPPVRPSYQW